MLVVLQTRSTPYYTTVLIWSLTNDIAPEADLREWGGGGICHGTPLLTLPFSKKEQMVPSD